MAPRRSRRAQTWSRLGAVALTVAALYIGLGVTGHLAPVEGLDLQGGTSVILTPTLAAGNHGRPSSAAINQAVDIIRQRVDGLGVSSSTVVRQNDNIVISVPGKNRGSVVNLVGQTAELRFREVLCAAPGVGAPPSAPVAVPTAPATLPTPAATTSPAATPTVGGATGASPSAHSLGRLTVTAQAAGVAVPLAASASPTPAVSTAASPAAPTAPATTTTAPATAPTAPTTPTTRATAAAGCTDTLNTSGGTPTQKPTPAALAAYNAINCATLANRRGGSTDDPNADFVTCDKSGIKYLLAPAKVIGTDVKGATATVQTNSQGTLTGGWEVNVSFTGRGQGRWSALTKATVNDRVAIVLDGIVQTAPVIQQQIIGDAQITGGFTATTSNDLANVLKYGALPLAFTAQQAESVSATLGRTSLNAGLLAGGIGIALVILYCFLYYRALGLVTVVSLTVSGLLVYGMVCLLGQAIGFTLTLAGIAGLIVSIGITADSFVVFYERLKDEVREGRTVRTSVERGWVRARRTIITADFVSLLAAVILYAVTVGDVRGFAFTLGLSTLLDLFVVFLFTKPLVTLLLRSRRFSAGRFSGLAAARRRPVARPLES